MRKVDKHVVPECGDQPLSDRGGVPLHMRRTRRRQGIFFIFIFFICSVENIMDMTCDQRMVKESSIASLSSGTRVVRLC
ncbi:hypothetical protein BDV37DRAFT_258176 [Aspergillus pseudonomiae]|uniref:Transmembrane protein n=1 Tax=Aspergillus pseudonomiae TaxID=1506151 RepID=A0A5N7D1M1_9EURO|nr:uncharacterized protein BDV37DRAFT_258176 [Aspergillus pseudonomiae]KAE8400274.1 hypothetical protein BDV37DRAFT_258176 [Aspergillus pseudonomiae]